VIVLFSDDAAEIFGTLPIDVRRRAANSIELIATFPRMYPVRRRGLMRGYRYFLSGRFLFYYSIASSEIRVTAIIPALMKQA